MATTDCHAFSFMEKTGLKKRKYHAPKRELCVCGGDVRVGGQMACATQEQGVPEFPVLLSVKSVASSSSQD